VRSASGRFYDVAPEAEIGTPQITRGIATADVDGDGRLDFAIGNQWDTSRFYRNIAPNAGAFVGFRLLLSDLDNTANPRVADHPAITAEVRVCVSSLRCQVMQIDGGNGHSGKRSHDLHFGLGRQDVPDSIQTSIRWRDASGTVRAAVLRVTPRWHVIALGAFSNRVQIR
jgi:hypothetical protein